MSLSTVKSFTEIFIGSDRTFVQALKRSRTCKAAAEAMWARYGRKVSGKAAQHCQAWRKLGQEPGRNLRMSSSSVSAAFYRLITTSKYFRKWRKTSVSHSSHSLFSTSGFV